MNKRLFTLVVFVFAALLMVITSCSKKRNPTEVVLSTDTNTPVSGTATYTPTQTRTNTPVNTSTNTATYSSTSTRTFTITETPVGPTYTYTLTRTSTSTSTNTATATRTNTFTSTGTATNTATSTNTYSVTNTSTSTATGTSTATATETATISNLTYYDFETNQIGDWRNVNVNDEQAISAISWDTGSAGIGGSKAMAATCAFTGALGASNFAKGAVERIFPTPADGTGHVVKFNVYVPAGLASLGYGAQPYVKTATGSWSTTGWNNLNTAGWVEFTMTVNTGLTTYNGPADFTQVTAVGIQITKGGGSADWSGTIFFDNIDLGSAPVATATPTATCAGGATMYHFNCDLMGWQLSTYSNPPNDGDLGFTSAAHNTNPTYVEAGGGSAEVVCAFTGTIGASTAAKGAAYIDTSGSPVDLTNYTLSVWVYVPATLVSAGGYGIKLYTKSGSWTWDDGGWNNLSASGWQKFTWDLGSALTNGNIASVQQIGIQVSKGGGSANWSGSIYFDEFDAVASTPPTPTPTNVSGAALYNYDSTIQGWSYSTWSTAGPPANGDLGFTAVAQSTTRAQHGPGSAAITCAFTGDPNNGTSAKGAFMLDTSAAPINLTGKTITAYVYVPSTLSSLGYGAMLYVKTTGWATAYGSWVNLDAVDNWVALSWDLSVTPPANINDVLQIGVAVSKGSGPPVSNDWSGTIYIDEYNY